MRTRTKLLLMIGTVVAGFIIFLGSLYAMNRKLDRTFIENSRAEKTYQISKTIDFCSRPLLTLVTDYSLWDDMITFTYHPTDKWAVDNVLPGLPAHHIDIVWIMDTTETVRYTLSQTKDEPLAHDSSFARSLRKQIAGNPWTHYFSLNNGRLVEVRSAPMQPSEDTERKSPPRGYFVAADVWDDSYLRELSDALQASLVLSARPDTLASDEKIMTSLRTSEFTVHQELLGPDGHEIAALLCTYASPTYTEMRVFVDRLLLGGLIFGVAIMLLLVTTLTH
jgi:sensor domain CHASE-containing protein